MRSSAEVALMNLFRGTGPTAEDLTIQRGIDQAMAAVITHDARHNPNGLEPASRVMPVGAVQAFNGPEPPRRGWAEEVPLSLPPGQAAIERLVSAALPSAHSPLERLKAEIAGLTVAQREQLLREIEASNDPRAAELKALVEAVGASGG